MAISIGNLTAGIATDADNVVTGTGIFDDMMETVNAHMAAQFNLGRITGSDYATVYLTVMQATIQQAVAFTIGVQKGNAEESLLFQKEVTEFAQTDRSSKSSPSPTSIMGAAAALSAEQAKGFKWNADQKYLKTILDAWSINISTAGVPATQVTAINATGDDNINDHIAAAEPTG